MNKNEYYSKIAQTIIARLKSRQIQGYYCDSKEDARKKALELKASVVREPTELLNFLTTDG